MSVLTQPADMAPLTRAAVAERLKGTEVDVPNTSTSGACSPHWA